MVKFALAIEDGDRTYSVPNVRSETELLAEVESILDRRVSPGFIESLADGSVSLVVIVENDLRISVERVQE